MLYITSDEDHGSHHQQDQQEAVARPEVQEPEQGSASDQLALVSPATGQQGEGSLGGHFSLGLRTKTSIPASTGTKYFLILEIF